jgi:hypothetical protein
MLLKSTLYIVSLIWLGFLSYIEIDIYKETPNIIERNKAFVAEALVPKVKFVEKFKETNGRLPTIQEFNSLLHIHPNEYETFNIKAPCTG